MKTLPITLVKYRLVAGSPTGNTADTKLSFYRILSPFSPEDADKLMYVGICSYCLLPGLSVQLLRYSHGKARFMKRKKHPPCGW